MSSSWQCIVRVLVKYCLLPVLACLITSPQPCDHDRHTCQQEQTIFNCMWTADTKHRCVLPVQLWVQHHLCASMTQVREKWPHRSQSIVQSHIPVQRAQWVTTLPNSCIHASKNCILLTSKCLAACMTTVATFLATSCHAGNSYQLVHK